MRLLNNKYWHDYSAGGLCAKCINVPEFYTGIVKADVTAIDGGTAVLLDACMQMANDNCEVCCAEVYRCQHPVNICERVSKRIAATALDVAERARR